MPQELEIEQLLNKISELGYRYTRPLKRPEAYFMEEPANELVKAIIIDTETTGFTSTDKIIELGMISFELCVKTGKVYKVIEVFNQLENPGFSIPNTQIHGITDAMVEGKAIDDAEVQNFLNDARLIIAHNAGFDRPFVEERFPVFENLPWVCSLNQINWKQEGISSAKQEFLAYTFGFHYEGHRASNDCEALLEILQSKLPNSGELVMKRFMESILQKRFSIAPLNSPFETKDKLKSRGYRWNAEEKFWMTDILLEDFKPEIEWIKREIYNGRDFRLQSEKLTAKNNFSGRKGPTEIITC